MFSPMGGGAADGFLMMMVMGAVVMMMREWITETIHAIVGYLFVSIEISDADSSEVYRWTENWIGDQPFAKRFNTLRVTLDEPAAPVTTRKLLASQQVNMVPGRGMHLFWFNSLLIFCVMQRRRGAANEGGGETMEKCITLYTINTGRGRATLTQVLACAQDASRNKECGEVGVFMPSSEYRAGWSRALGIPSLAPGTAILPGDNGKKLVADAREFLASKEWYQQMGIPHRRGYLLYGPPGTGKSTFVHTLASELGLDVAFLSLSALNGDQQLMNLLSRAPKNAIIALEDIDAMCPESRAQATPSAPMAPLPRPRGEVTLSGLLNALDGVAAQHGRIVVMTSNHPERLDPALVRPGRIDVKVELGHADDTQIATMFARFFPAASHAMTAAFVKAIRTSGADKVSMATIQRYLLARKLSPALAITDWPGFHKAQTQHDAKMMAAEARASEHETRIDMEEPQPQPQPGGGDAAPAAAVPLPPMQAGHSVSVSVAAAPGPRHSTSPYAALSMADTQAHGPRIMVRA